MKAKDSKGDSKYKINPLFIAYLAIKILIASTFCKERYEFLL